MLARAATEYAIASQFSDKEIVTARAVEVWHTNAQNFGAALQEVQGGTTDACMAFKGGFVMIAMDLCELGAPHPRSCCSDGELVARFGFLWCDTVTDKCALSLSLECS